MKLREEQLDHLKKIAAGDEYSKNQLKTFLIGSLVCLICFSIFNASLLMELMKKVPEDIQNMLWSLARLNWIVGGCIAVILFGHWGQMKLTGYLLRKLEEKQ